MSRRPHCPNSAVHCRSKPGGLPIALVVGRDGKPVLAERGQMFPEDVEAIASLV